MIQDIYPHKFHNEFRPEAKPQPDSPVLCFDGKKVLCKAENGKVIFPNASQIDSELVYAFAVDDREYFLDISANTIEMEGFEYADMRSIRQQALNVYGMIIYTGVHLYQWYRENVFCGSCGAETEHSLTERARICPECGRHSYPHIMPAVIVGVIDKGRLLVTKYKEGFKYYALVAGFTEIGETLEETVAREVMEETGLKVKNIRYYKSQPWGVVKDLLVGFFCDLDGSDEIRIDENELKLAEWKYPEEIELQPDSYSLTNEMMTVFKNGSVQRLN